MGWDTESGAVVGRGMFNSEKGESSFRYIRTIDQSSVVIGEKSTNIESGEMVKIFCLAANRIQLLTKVDIRYLSGLCPDGIMYVRDLKEIAGTTTQWEGRLVIWSVRKGKESSAGKIIFASSEFKIGLSRGYYNCATSIMREKCTLDSGDGEDQANRPQHNNISVLKLYSLRMVLLEQCEK